MDGEGVGIELFEWLDIKGRAELAKWAEEHGFQAAYMAEITDPDVFVTCTLAAAATSRLRFAPLVAQIGPRSAPMLASGAASVANIAPGRFALGLGVSSKAIVHGWHGVTWSQPLIRARETVLAIRKILAGERSNEDGEQVHTKGFALRFPPSVPMPIFLGAVNPGMLRVAGEVADGVMLTFVPVGRAAEVIGIVNGAAEAAGRPKPEVVHSVMCDVTDDLAASRREMRETLLFYMAVPAYRAAFSWLGYEDEMNAAGEAFARRDKDGVRKAVTDRLIDDIALIGSAGEVRERLGRFMDGGVTSPALAAMNESRAYDTLRAFAPRRG